LIPVHGMNRDQCSAESHVSCWGALVPVYATNRDRFSEMNQDRPPNDTNRDQCLLLVPIDKPNRDRCDFSARPKTHFLLMHVVWAQEENTYMNATPRPPARLITIRRAHASGFGNEPMWGTSYEPCTSFLYFCDAWLKNLNRLTEAKMISRPIGVEKESKWFVSSTSP
jgi:hypothetical protein